MAGIYIHIPFCKQKCTYCDFHFSTSLKYKERVINAIYKEIELKKDYFTEEVNTIYFGGGTPSFIDVKEIEKIIDLIHKNYSVDLKELTLEANPDDLDLNSLKALKEIGINRLSIGIQTFNDEVLKWMNRSHDSKQAIKVMEDAHKVGFDNISLDLIFAIPNITIKQWESDIEQAIKLEPQHISSYNLTVEQKTALDHLVRSGKIQPIDDFTAAKQFDLLIDKLMQKGFDHYEISNFGLPGYYSMHNSAYWKQEKYIGIGPSAHSYNRIERQWNISNNLKYSELIENNKPYFEIENLSKKDIFNEYLLTGLRTIWGCDFNFIHNLFPNHIHEINAYINKHKSYFQTDNSHFKLTKEGRFYADRIISDLFI